MKTSRITALAAVAASLVFAAAPAGAHNHAEDSSDQPKAEAAEHANEAPADVTAMPSNDLSTSMADKVSSPGFSAEGSLHSSAKVLNNTAATNDLKSAFKAARPVEPAPQKPAMGEIAAPKSAETPAVATAEPALAPAAPVNAEPEAFELQVGADAGATAIDPAAPVADGAVAPSPRGSLLPALAGVAALALAAGLFFARMIRAKA